jgi:putative radical SAM enzyme (TIGR03279 family)
MLVIEAVESGTIAEELGFEAGDALVSVNGEPVVDLVDFLVEETREQLRLEVRGVDGELHVIELEHDSDEPLGLVLPHPEPRQCGNNCIFCFVHQLPRGMRRTLYVKDEDYRFSYLYGAYVTLTNITDGELRRIVDKRLSPLYVSVHATDNVLRQRLLGKQARPIVPILQRLVEGGIEVHTQVVVCPELNDGVVLERTCRELVSLAPGVRSLAIVPVGLTGHRQQLPSLRVQTPAEALALVRWVESKQMELLPRLGTRFVFAADELYLKAQHPLPPLADYEELAQIENGVGLVAQFRLQADEVLAAASELELPPVSLVTGASAAGELTDFAAALAKQCGVELRVEEVENRFFGGQVTVAGLLTGTDLIEQLAGRELGEVLLLPDVMLRDGEDVLLDDVTVERLSETLQVQVEVVEPTPWGIWDMLDTLAVEAQHETETEDDNG